MKRLSLIALLLSIVAASYAAVTPQTYEFAVYGNDTLRMDVYVPDDNVGQHPAVLFAFGGAFIGGQRDKAEYLPYFNFLADNGIVAITTDYRPTLKKDPSLLTTSEGIAQAFNNAVYDAVADFYTATLYVLGNAEKFRINPRAIFASGSSAGAITALQAEYGICHGMAKEILPIEFNYAGVISFAGAIFSVGDLSWPLAPCPMQLFHGNNDHNVPYKSVTWGPIVFSGSEVIASSLVSKIVPCELYTFDGVDHAVCHTPMTDNLYDILGFIVRVTTGKEKLSIRAMECAPSMPQFTPPVITVENIIKANL